MGAKTFNWKEILDGNNDLESEELLLTNTFLNSKNQEMAQFKDLQEK
jgi:hypothetical protein